VPKVTIVDRDYDLSLNRYSEVAHEEVTYRSPQEIMKVLTELEEEIQAGIRDLEGRLR